MADNRGAESSDAPVIEVAVGVTFEPVADLGAIGLARLAGEWNDDYPKMREVPGRPPTELDPGMVLQIGSGGLPPRLWLLSQDENDLVQIQNDTLVVNWRRLTPNDVYPGHIALVARFERLWNDLSGRIGRAISLKPKVVEWTYVDRLENHVLARGGLTFLDMSLDERLPGDGRAFDFQIVRELSEGGQRDGYLTIAGNPVASDDAQFYAVNITTRLDAAGLGSSDLVGRLRRAHDISLSAFKSVVNAELQGGGVVQ